MVAISLYRGNLHRVSDAPRRWPMPPHSITLDQFRILIRKRDEALARIADQKPPNSNSNVADEREEAKVKEEPHEGEEEQRGAQNPKVSDPKPSKAEGESKETIDGNAKAKEQISDVAAVKGSETETSNVKIEASNKFDTDKERRKIELEKKLQVLNQKKHHLVQMLKQILNAEEEIKRRNAQSATLRSSIPLPPETAVDMGSATRHVPKLNVEVNFSGDLSAESDVPTNYSAHGRQMPHMHITSPSAVSFTRSFQQNTILGASKSSLAATGHLQTPPSGMPGITGAVSSSPSRFAPGHQGHHHSASLPQVSVPGSHFLASSPSPAASGGSSSVFRDSRLTSSS